MSLFFTINLKYFIAKIAMVCFAVFGLGITQSIASQSSEISEKTPLSINDQCLEYSNIMPGKFNKGKVAEACKRVEVLPGCASHEGRPIFHYENEVNENNSRRDHKNILVVSLIHGDELDSGSISRRWMSRLETINSRNKWRIIPVANPDGWFLKSRTNARGVDINRNFPSQDWTEMAVKLWKSKYSKDPRRNPGLDSASETETKCIIKHLSDFEPDFVIAIHTPYGVLDYDGPNISLPKFNEIPWVRLGTFPGSLGRYMWVDKSVPVLTVELKNSQILSMMDKIDRLQDISGTVAIRTDKAKSKNDD